MIYWITGNSGSGKSTLAHIMKKAIPNSIILDGDEMRDCWELGFTKEDRHEQNQRACLIANLLCEQGHDVIIATICPYTDLREHMYLLSLHEIRWIYLPGGKPSNKMFPYEWDHFKD